MYQLRLSKSFTSPTWLDASHVLLLHDYVVEAPVNWKNEDDLTIRGSVQDPVGIPNTHPNAVKGEGGEIPQER